MHSARRAHCTVLISGETGTGKELWGKLVHDRGPRSKKPYIPVNCAALTVTLAESQLFGHEKGSFTGADRSLRGGVSCRGRGHVSSTKFAKCRRNCSPSCCMSARREVTPVGAAYPVNIDVQIIAATNRDLEVEVAEGRFREDLYYRLNMVELRVPPLRDRVEDIPELVEFFSGRFATRYQRPLWKPDAETLKRFCEFHWPGNVRQLSHVIEQSYVLDCVPACRTSNVCPKSTSRFLTWTSAGCGRRPSVRPCAPPAATRAGRPSCWAFTLTP